MRGRALFIGLLLAAGACGDDEVGLQVSACPAEARTCDGSWVRYCDPATLSWEYLRQCPVGEGCLDGQCSAGVFPDVVVADTGTAADTVSGTAADTVSGTDAGTDADTGSLADTDPGTVADTGSLADTDTGADAGPVTDTDPGAASDTVGVTDTGPLADTVGVADTGPDVVDAGPDVVEPPDPFAPGPLAYANVANILVTGDLHRVKWHPGGAWALILSPGGQVLRYDAETRAVALAGTVGARLTDLDVDPDGGYFVVLGESGDTPSLFRVHLDDADQLVVAETIAVPLGVGVAVAAEPGSSPARFAVGAKKDGATVPNYLYTYTVAGGLSAAKGYNLGDGLTDLMWGDPALYGQSPNVVTSEGWPGAGSNTWLLATDAVVANNWSNGFGNGGRAAWRPGFGGYGLVSGSYSNKVYVFDGAWQMATLPVPTGAGPQGIAWRRDGQRALIVGRVIGSPAYAVVIDHPVGPSPGYGAVFVDRSIPGFTGAPWFGSSSGQHLLDVDWRPHACDEGLIVGADSGTTWSPTFGVVIRFHDETDPACAP